MKSLSNEIVINYDSKIYVNLHTNMQRTYGDFPSWNKLWINHLKTIDKNIKFVFMFDGCCKIVFKEDKHCSWFLVRWS